MSRPGAASRRTPDKRGLAAQHARTAPQLDIVSSIPAAEAPLPAVAGGGTGSPPTSQAGPAPTHFAPVLHRGRVALDLVDVAGDRLRERDRDWEALIAATYAEIGQLTPIRLVRETSGRFLLDGFGFGVARLEAARIAGWGEIDAEWCDRAAVDQRFYRLPEIIEAIARRRLAALDECRFLAEYKAIHLRLFPGTANGGDPKKKQALRGQNAGIAFWQVAAESTGLGRRSVEAKVAIWEGLSEAARHRLAGSRLADSQAALAQIAAIAFGLQAKVLDLLLAMPPRAANVAEAIVLAQGKRPRSADDKRFNAVAGNLTRLSAAARRPLWTAYAEEIIPVLKDEGLI